MSNIVNLNTYPHHIYVQIILDSLTTNKSLKYHDLIMEEKYNFDFYSIPINIVTPDEQTYLDSIKAFYQSNLIYKGHSNKSYFYTHNFIKNKQIYGKNYEIIYSNIRVYDANEIIFQANHINPKSLKMAYIKAFERLSENFIKNYKKMLTQI